MPKAAFHLLTTVNRRIVSGGKQIAAVALRWEQGLWELGKRAREDHSAGLDRGTEERERKNRGTKCRPLEWLEVQGP